MAVWSILGSSGGTRLRGGGRGSSPLGAGIPATLEASGAVSVLLLHSLTSLVLPKASDPTKRANKGTITIGNTA